MAARIAHAAERRTGLAIAGGGGHHVCMIDDSYWAVPERLLAGPLPTGADREAQRAAIQTLLGAGIRCVIDLRTPVEPPGVRVLFEKLSDDAVWIGFPILDGAAPTVHGMQAILDAIDASIARARPVYVHCQGGRGRTGTVVACHWIRHGMFEPEAALEELMRRRRGLSNGERSSPETGAQFRLVRSWTRGK